MKKHYALLIAGFCLLVTGLVLGYGPIMEYWQGRNKAEVLNVPFSTAASAGTTAVTPPAQKISGKPVRLEIPSLHIDLQVAEGHYNEQAKTWTLSKDKAHYAVVTPLANNEAGNTFIYGHNRKDVFKTLNQVKPGEKAIVTTDNGHRFVYVFKAAFETNPSDDSLFHYEGAPILTVQTCSGVWYQNRQLFTFTFESAE